MKKFAFLFPGQGTQFFGMGKDFYENYTDFKDAFDEASYALNMDLKKLCFEENNNLNLTEYTQPAIVAFQYGIYKVLNQEGINADICAGLSLGEYTAIAVGKAMTFTDAIKAVHLRGKLMQGAAPIGETMMCAVIGLSDEVVEQVCKDVSNGVSITNYNLEGQVVIGGFREDVLMAKKQLEIAGAIAIKPLNISVASHCLVQREAAEELGNELAKIRMCDIRIPYVTNVDASVVEDKDRIVDLLKRQLYSPVQWKATMDYLSGTDNVECFELGSSTLSKLFKRHTKDMVVHSIKSVEDIAVDD